MPATHHIRSYKQPQKEEGGKEQRRKKGPFSLFKASVEGHGYSGQANIPSRSISASDKTFLQGILASSTEKVNQTLDKAVGRGATRKFTTNLKQFFIWASSKGVPKHLLLPPPEELIYAWVADMAGRIAGPTIRGKISALRNWVVFEGEEWTGGQMLEALMKGAHKATPESSFQEKREPVTMEMIQALVEDLDRSDPVQMCTLFTAVLAFYSQCRLGELLHSNQNSASFNPKHNPTFSAVKRARSSDSRIIHLPETKTKGLRGDDTLIPKRRNDPSDPVNLLDEHANVNKLTKDDPLASYLEDRIRKTLTKDKMLKICNGVWEKRGIERITGHSFCIGGTTYYLMEGFNPDVIKQLGRWDSDSFLRYWRNLDAIAQNFIEGLAQKHAGSAARTPVAVGYCLQHGCSH
ncbi:hypothetical protein C8J56DRAFT_787973 [Mycena floridula]|nr:hypothetical protein C8J56DRAFT_787973 [Mycena floridula]